MTETINIPRISPVICGESIPENSIDDVSAIVTWWLIDSYYRPAMQDYFMARVARWNCMHRSYAWLASQSIEKMMKFNCLCFGLSLSKDGLFYPGSKEKTVGHDYLALIPRLMEVSDCLNWDLYENIPNDELDFEIGALQAPTVFKLKNGMSKSIYFSKCKTSELLEYFNAIGDTNNRYGAMGISTGFIDILLLDALVAKLRSRFLAGDLNGHFRNILQSGVDLFNKDNFEFKIADSLFIESDGYSAHVGDTTFPELLDKESSLSHSYAKKWLTYRGALPVPKRQKSNSPQIKNRGNFAL